jgi:hypothetical protein
MPGISAIGMLVRTGWRRHWRASLFLAVVAGLSASVIGASFQAAARADTSLERFVARSQVYNRVVFGCPPGVDPDKVSSQNEFLAKCGSRVTAERLRSALRGIGAIGGIDRSAVVSTMVVALLDPSVKNSWGRLTLLAGVSTPRALPPGRPIILEGRGYNPDAPDEVVISEDAAKSTGLHAGDTVHISSWRQASLDDAIDGIVAPQLPAFSSKVVGVVRNLENTQVPGSGSLSDSTIPGDVSVYAGPAWTAAHATGLAGYGSGVLVKLHGGDSGIPAFERALKKLAPQGWNTQTSSVISVDPASIQRVIDLERRALLVFAFIAIAASVVFVGLTAIRQLRRESVNAPNLMALGMTHRNLRTINVVRALTIAAPACVVAAIGIIALSPFGPLGLARRLEYELPVRVDAGVIVVTLLAILLLFAFAGLLTPVDAKASRRARLPAASSRLEPAVRGMGPVAAVGATVARGRSTGAAIAVTAIAVAAGVAAGGVVASFDHLLGDPARYGATWDLAVGQYSEQPPLDHGIARLRANPAVVTAAGYYEDSEIATVDGKNTLLVAFDDYIGHASPVIVSGRAPETDKEVALGRATARATHKGIGDQVKVASAFGSFGGKPVSLRVVGIAVVNDPVSSIAGAGNGAFVSPHVYAQMNGHKGPAQSVVIRVDPHRDRAAAIESVRKDFSGSIREAVPQVDLRNLERLRTVPWLIAGLIAILALATLVHALVTILGRNRVTLAVLSTLGFTRGQRRGVAVFASVVLVTVGVLIGIPIGLILSTRIWHAVSDGMDLPSAATVPWATLIVTALGALGLAAAVALIASRGSARMTPSEQLRVE